MKRNQYVQVMCHQHMQFKSSALFFLPFFSLIAAR